MTEKDFGQYLALCNKDNILHPETFAVAFEQTTWETSTFFMNGIRERAAELGRSLSEFSNAQSRASKMFRAGAIKARTSVIPPLGTFSARELQDMDIPPTEYVVAEILPQGLTLFVGASKIGKSWFVLDLCLSIAQGLPFLTRETERKSCLYLALEDTEGRLKRRMDKLLAGKRAPMGFDYACSALPIGLGLIQQLEDFCDNNPSAGLIVIDTLAKVRGGTQKNESAYAADYRETGILKAFADRRKICLILVHHDRKVKGLDAFDNISGTTALMGAADTILVLQKKERNDTRAKLHITGRDVEASELILEFEKEPCKWKFVGSADFVEQQAAEEAYKRNPIATVIREFVVNSPGGFWIGTMKDLMDAAQKTYNIRLSDTPESLSRDIKKLSGDLLKYDQIAYRRIRNGTGGGKHEFRVSHLGNASATVYCEQPSLL